MATVEPIRGTEGTHLPERDPERPSRSWDSYLVSKWGLREEGRLQFIPQFDNEVKFCPPYSPLTSLSQDANTRL